MCPSDVSKQAPPLRSVERRRETLPVEQSIAAYCCTMTTNHGASLDLYDLLDDIGIDLAIHARMSNTGRTLLHEAAIKGDVSAIDQLIQDGANIHKTTFLGRNTALHLASERGNIHAIKTLLSHRETNPNAKNKYRETPLHLAQSVAVADVLVSHGASLDCRDSNNHTPLQAISNRKDESEDNKQLIQHLTNLIEERTRTEIRKELHANRERRRRAEAVKAEQSRLEKEENARELNNRLLASYRRWRRS